MVWTDGIEVNQFKTDPAKADTDGDGLSDGDEVNKYKTDPVKIDTDGGGVNDGAEVTAKTNPLDPKDDILRNHDDYSPREREENYSSRG